MKTTTTLQIQKKQNIVKRFFVKIKNFIWKHKFWFLPLTLLGLLTYALWNFFKGLYLGGKSLIKGIKNSADAIGSGLTGLGSGLGTAIGKIGSGLGTAIGWIGKNALPLALGGIILAGGGYAGLRWWKNKPPKNTVLPPFNSENTNQKLIFADNKKKFQIEKNKLKPLIQKTEAVFKTIFQEQKDYAPPQTKQNFYPKKQPKIILFDPSMLPNKTKENTKKIINNESKNYQVWVNKRKQQIQDYEKALKSIPVLTIILPEVISDPITPKKPIKPTQKIKLARKIYQGEMLKWEKTNQNTDEYWFDKALAFFHLTREQVKNYAILSFALSGVALTLKYGRDITPAVKLSIQFLMNFI